MEELKNKILQAMQSDFIGDIQFDEDEIEQMKEDCKRFYCIAQSSWSKIYKKEDICELIVLIVNIAKSWNDESEGRFWTKLFGEIFEDSSISPIKFYNDFENCLTAYNKKLFHSKENKRMFREVFLLHAFAPEKSGESFIRLLWNWYSDIDVINFDYQHNDALYTQLALFLNMEFGGKADLDADIDFEGKTYSIKSSFKYLYVQDKDVGVRLLDKIFSNFDDIYGFRQETTYTMGNGKTKSVVYFLASYANQNPTHNKGFEHNDYLQLTFDEAYSMLTFENTKEILKAANDYLKG